MIGLLIQFIGFLLYIHNAPEAPVILNIIGVNLRLKGRNSASNSERCLFCIHIESVRNGDP
jgi:hypothetical protein